jgi:hypothetical protein
MVGGTWTTLKTGTAAAVAPGTKYYLRLEAVGPALKAFINGKLVAEVEDTQLPTGSVGVTMYKASVQVDKGTVTAL